MLTLPPPPLRTPHPIPTTPPAGVGEFGGKGDGGDWGRGRVEAMHPSKIIGWHNKTNEILKKKKMDACDEWVWDLLI